mmetsp:Transcript_40843/g.107913  ORF Transcript_40843/g.107913 Transcript_40843/m.107913 type:complete len:83 (+) Transcript_40843:722-970(+)
MVQMSSSRRYCHQIAHLCIGPREGGVCARGDEKAAAPPVPLALRVRYEQAEARAEGAYVFSVRAPWQSLTCLLAYNNSTASL